MRPGPLDTGMHKVYIRRKRGEEPITYQLPELEEFLSDTYGVITYQEQVMRISQKLAGISLAEADVLRKAVGKKDAALIRKELGKFVEKAVALGHDRKIINDIASQIETFGRYGFNKSHAVAYSILSYQTAWLKTHFPAEFMAALLSSQIGDTDSVVKYINEVREIGLELLPPDVNESNYKFTVIADKRIRFGLGAIRNVGKTAIDAILAARASGSFSSLFDLCNRVDLRMCNKRVLEAMIHAGALDSLGGHRSQLVAALDTAIREASLAQEDVASGQVSIFGDVPGGTAKPAHQTTLPNVAPWSESERLANEKVILGFYTSGHPLEPYRTECELFSTHSVNDIGTWTPESISLCCVITSIKRQTSKKSGAEFARLTIEDFSGSTEVLVFPEAWSVINDQVKADVPVVMKGGYSRRDEGADNPTFIVEGVTKLAEKRTNGQVAVAIDLAPGSALDPEVMRDVQGVIHGHPGSAPLEIRWSDGLGAAARWRSRSLRLSADGVALKELRSLLGDERVSVVLGT